MREKIKFIVSICVCMCVFTACGKESKYNEKEQQVIADYVAQTVLKHSEGYENKLVDISGDFYLLTEEEDYGESLTDDNKNNDNKNKGTDLAQDNSDFENSDKILTGDSGTKTNDNAVNEENDMSKLELASVLGFKKGIEAYVTGSKVLKEYASSSYIIDVNDDERLLEIIFKINNTTKTDCKSDADLSNLKYKLSGENSTYYPLLTAIENDLVYFNKKIKAGKSSEAVLLFKISKEEVGDEFSLVIENDNKAVDISVKSK